MSGHGETVAADGPWGRVPRWAVEPRFDDPDIGICDWCGSTDGTRWQTSRGWTCATCDPANGVAPFRVGPSDLRSERASWPAMYETLDDARSAAHGWSALKR